MKIYSIIITAVAVCALGLSAYLYWQGGDLRKDFGVCQDQREGLLKDKAQLESEVSDANRRLTEISHSATVLKSTLNSFMFAGDVRALTVGSKESAEVEKAITNLDDSTDRMMAEQDWKDFETTRYLNPLLSLLRNLVHSIEKGAAAPSNVGK